MLDSVSLSGSEVPTDVEVLSEMLDPFRFSKILQHICKLALRVDWRHDRSNFHCCLFGLMIKG